ncbi:GNAT family N-acetyltransferase [Halorubellus sp. JP-L1]|uniref:GNAT family N-acetyltransferase n=1 Tax=Halorubellus sp. JP-L1 TaxID=2715753 RepID=UPI00140B7DC8|nr:GNAT family N-acetyltransferase [Halorubellus sp. JP-L1]NHN43228.1 GNAT family N-acetyltransferase [Halorubellus sp. JP-L1]
MASNACSSWWHGDCEGTEHCPPRCPRFLDAEGRPYLVQPTADDSLDGVVDMYRDYPAEHRSMGIPPAQEPVIRDWLDTLLERGRNFVATLDGTVVGHAGYAPADADVPEMLVYVDPDHHGHGLGTELTKHVLAHAASSGCDGVALDVARDNATAIHVYRELGFEPTDETPMEYEMEVSTDASIVLHVQRPPAERDLEKPTDDD